MKQYTIDQLREPDYERILEFLDSNAEKSALGGIYRVEIPEEHYATLQREHSDCQPYYFAIHLNYSQVDFELLIRSQEKLRCHCIAYATPQQRDYIIHYADRMLEQLEIRI